MSREPGGRPLRRDFIIGLVAILVVIAIPLVIFVPLRSPATPGDPWSGVPENLGHLNHASLMPGPYETGQDVTQACLECHPDAGEQMLRSEHFTWLNPPVEVDGNEIAFGKAVALNNFCLGVQGNWPKCTSCHAGYGWSDETFDFSDPENIDCLVCHDQSGQYAKGESGYPAEGSDLVAAAQSVADPSRWNCGQCHFEGGGGNGVKHGDLDDSLIYPDETIDVHMGKYDFVCTDCHTTVDHQIMGTSTSVSLDARNEIFCTDCHDEKPHADERLNAHTDGVACQSCHIPTFALKDPTKLWWDWSTAGNDDIPEDHYTYLKIKGSFVYDTDVVPEYFWSNGTSDRYLLGDPIVTDGPTPLNKPNGDISDPTAKIWPFKVHRAKQPYDTELNILLQPKLAGEGGYWVDFDWPLALQLGADISGTGYSGHYGFTRTDMWWPITHMVQPAEKALQCNDCHGDGGRMDWEALGYPSDPMFSGGRSELGVLGAGQ
jgi:octaheme c-type cytochrome (tetrathionate reductase family)